MSAREALVKAHKAWAKKAMQLEIEFEPEDEPCIGICGRCGAYWDMRYVEVCPPPCGGYVG